MPCVEVSPPNQPTATPHFHVNPSTASCLRDLGAKSSVARTKAIGANLATEPHALSSASSAGKNSRNVSNSIHTWDVSRLSMFFYFVARVIVLPDKSGPTTAILKVLCSTLKRIHEVLGGERQLPSTKNKNRKSPFGQCHSNGCWIRRGTNNEQCVYRVPRSVSKYFLIRDKNKDVKWWEDLAETLTKCQELPKHLGIRCPDRLMHWLSQQLLRLLGRAHEAGCVCS